MTDPDQSAYRLHYRASGDSVTVREGEEVESDDGIFEVRMPIATTGQVRNEGDDPLTRNELNGMARQLNDRAIGVFPAHGDDTMVAAGRYSPFEKLGEWTDASIDARDDENVLMATARMPDPETLPAATGDYRQALAILKEQAKRGIAQDASIGWRDDESFPGGVDLMEASIVGIGADWRTNSNDEAAEVVARAAVDAGADPEELVAVVRDAVRVDADTEDSDVSMTDDDPGTDAGTTDEQDASDGDTTERSEAEYREQMLEMQRQQTELLQSIVEREGDKDGDDEDDEEEDDEDEEQAADEPDAEQTAEDADGDADPDTEHSADTEDADDAGESADELRSKIDQLEADLEAVRSGDVDVDTPEEPDTDAEQDADVSDEDTEDEPTDTQDAESPTQGLGDYR